MSDHCQKSVVINQGIYWGPGECSRNFKSMEDIVFTEDNVNAALVWFASHVKNMRDNQKDYFKTRSKAALIASKEQEKEIDKAIDKILEVAGISLNG